jgi:dTDP-4-dehydrorhamnose reductase
MSRRVVVLGSTGQLGTELVRELQSAGHRILALTRSEVDITDAAHVEKLLTGFLPEVVINAAAYNMVDVAEKEPLAAFQVNALAVRHMAVICRQLDARLVHFSTDYVFDGTADRPYTEQGATHPLGAYAVSKLAGEIYAQAYLDNPLIIRTSGVFGPAGLQTARGNFLELMLRLAARSQPIRVVADHVASPTYAPALASRTMEMIERGLTGIFHAGGGTAISWHDYAALIFEEAGVKPELRPTNEREYRTAARRPKYSALCNSKLEGTGVTPMPPLREAVRDYLSRRGQSANLTV